jgi:hypothetical protein
VARCRQSVPPAYRPWQPCGDEIGGRGSCLASQRANHRANRDPLRRSGDHREGRGDHPHCPSAPLDRRGLNGFHPRPGKRRGPLHRSDCRSRASSSDTSIRLGRATKAPVITAKPTPLGRLDAGPNGAPRDSRARNRQNSGKYARHRRFCSGEFRQPGLDPRFCHVEVPVSERKPRLHHVVLDFGCSRSAATQGRIGKSTAPNSIPTRGAGPSTTRFSEPLRGGHDPSAVTAKTSQRNRMWRRLNRLLSW